MIESIINSNKKIYLGAVSANSGNTAEIVQSVCLMSKTTGIILYKRTNYYAKFFTINADRTISYGAESAIITTGSFAYHNMCYAISQDKVLLSYSNSDNTALYIRTLSISGTTVNYSTATTVVSTASWIYSNYMSYDPVIGGIHLTYVRFTSSKYSVCSNGITGSTLTTVSAMNTLLNSTQASDLSTCYDTSSSRLVVSYKATNLYGVACSYSAGTYTVGTPVQIQASPTTTCDLLYDTKRSTLIFTSRKNNHCCYTPATISGVTLTAGTTVETSIVSTAYYMRSVQDTRSNRIFTIAGAGDTSTNVCFLVTYLADGGFGFSKTKTISDCYVTFPMSYKDGTIVLFDSDGSGNSTLKLRYIKIS